MISLILFSVMKTIVPVLSHTWRLGLRNIDQWFLDSSFRKTNYFQGSARISRRIVLESILNHKSLWKFSTKRFGYVKIPKNAFVIDMGKITAHWFRRGGAHNLFVTRKHHWTLNIVKCWGSSGEVDDVNTILRYLLEETSPFEKKSRMICTRKLLACLCSTTTWNLFLLLENMCNWSRIVYLSFYHT